MKNTEFSCFSICIRAGARADVAAAAAAVFCFYLFIVLFLFLLVDCCLLERGYIY